MDRSLYEEHAALERDHWWFVARRAIIERVIRRHVPAAGSRQILDVGCGTGGMLPMLASFGHVSGIEAEPMAVDHCHTAFGGFEVTRGEVPDDVPSGGSFHLVTSFDVIEHIEDDLAALRALRAATAPDGSVVVTVPALSWLWSDHDVVNGHQRRYTKGSLARAVEAAGLRLAHVSYFNTVLLPAVAAARAAGRLRLRSVTPHSDFTMPSAPVNAVLTRLMTSERTVAAGPGLPLGVSLIAVARPDGAARP